jgi:inosose dehydratase
LAVKIGSAPDSWGVWFPSEPNQIPWQRYLDEVAEAGYEWTELGPFGYLPTDPDNLGGELEQRDLKVSGTFAMADLEIPEVWPQLEAQVLGAGALLAALGANYLVLIDDTYTDLFTGEAKLDTNLDADAWQRLVDTIHRVADIARSQFDLQVVFHPHAETHVEYEEQIERLLEQTDPERVQFCLDTGHHAYRGGDPIAFMRKHHERITYLHLKSVDRHVQRRTQQEGIPFARAVQQDMFVEPSQGAVDFLAFTEVLNDIEFDGFAIVEQDMYPAPHDKPLPIARRTRAYLREIGIG